MLKMAQVMLLMSILVLASATKKPDKPKCVFDSDIQECGPSFQMQSTSPEGYRVKFDIPVVAATKSWTMLVVFDSPLIRMHFPDGEITKQNDTEFIIKNKGYNGKLKKGSRFTSEMSVQYNRGSRVDISAIIFDPVEFICASTDYAQILAARYRSIKVAETNGSSTSGHAANKGNGCSIKYLNEFPDGFKAIFEFPGATKDLTSWTATIEFDGDLTSFKVPKADIVGGVKTGKIFRLKSKSDKAHLSKGTALKLQFTANFPSKIDPRPRLERATFDAHICASAPRPKNNKNLVGASWIGGNYCKKQ